MDDEDEKVFVKDVSRGSRKKQKTLSLREKEKHKRYSAPSGFNLFTPCKHKNRQFLCSYVRPGDSLLIRNKLYSKPDKCVQDNKIAGWISIRNVKRHRPRTSGTDEGKTNKPHSFQVKYSIPTRSGKFINVCKKFFIHLTLIKASRLNTICKLVKNGEEIKERRGGDHVSNKSIAKKNNVRNFLRNLKGSESHYNRQKSCRIYLNGELSINKLRKVYNATVSRELQLSKSMFQRIFCSEFNIGFKTPASDICSLCYKLAQQIKATVDKNKKVELMIQKRLHKKRASAYYELLRRKDNEETLTLCFDMQQVQPLPKTPIQQAYYARQIGYYNLCIVDQNSLNPFFLHGQKTKQAGAQKRCHLHFFIFLNIALILKERRLLDYFVTGVEGKIKIILFFTPLFTS